MISTILLHIVLLAAAQLSVLSAADRNLSNEVLSTDNFQIPVINITSLYNAFAGIDSFASFSRRFRELDLSDADFQHTVTLIGNACRYTGFFYVKGHSVPVALQENLENLSRTFFSLPLEVKREIDMKLGGKAWRGYFGVGDEVTSGIPDQKEGIYLGTEGSNDDPRILHGANLWPSFQGDSNTAAHFRSVISEYMKEMKKLGTILMISIGLSLNINLGEDFESFFADPPTELFRVFNYPPFTDRFGDRSFAVGEHTDYGFITILRQDVTGGLQVKKTVAIPPNEEDNEVKFSSSWITAAPVENAFVINLGDALERTTGGLYKATPHRVAPRHNTTTNRISYPYFFDPSFDTSLTSVYPRLSEGDQRIADINRRLVGDRWDRMDPSAYAGTYGHYLTQKVAKVFPDLAQAVVSATGAAPAVVGGAGSSNSLKEEEL